MSAEGSRMHVGRSFSGNEIEQTCGCPLTACGLVDTLDLSPECEHHPFSRGKTLRQGHRAEHCPALSPDTLVENFLDEEPLVARKVES